MDRDLDGKETWINQAGKTKLHRENGCSLPRPLVCRGVGIEVRQSSSTFMDKDRGKGPSGRTGVCGYVYGWHGGADKRAQRGRMGTWAAAAKLTAVKELKQRWPNAEETPLSLQDLMTRGSHSSWQLWPRCSGWGVCSSTDVRRRGSSPEWAALSRPNLRWQYWAAAFHPLCPRGCSTLPTGAREKWSSNIDKSSDSTVQRMCQDQAGRLLSWTSVCQLEEVLRCDDKTWKRKTKTKIKTRKITKVESKSLNSLKTVKISGIWCLNIKRRDCWSFNANIVSESV